MSFVCFNITNVQPLRIGTFGSSTAQKSMALDYISGTSIRGAFLNELYNILGAKADDFLTNVCFYNAYPEVGEKVFYPTPLHLRIDKHSWRKASISSEDIEISNLTLEHKNNAVNNIDYKFLNISKDGITGHKVKKTYTTHHSKYKKKDEKGEANNLFRYEAIEKNQNFKGIIYCSDDEMMSAIIKVIDREYIYIGSSKNSSYGKCKITFVSQKEKLFSDDYEPEGNQLVIRSLSDCIFKDDFGMPTNSPNEDIIRSYFGDVSLKKAFVNAGVIEGFNKKWNLRLPKETTVKAGSVWVYTLENKDMLNNENITNFENVLHGEKNYEGYGWIQVMRKHSNTFRFKNILNAEENCGIDMSSNLKYNESNNNLNIILKNIQGMKDQWLTEIASKELAQTVCKLNNNVIRTMMDQLRRIGDKSSYEKSNEWIKRNSGITKNKDVFCYNGYNFKEIFDFLTAENLVEDSSCVKTFDILKRNFPKNRDNTSFMVMVRKTFNNDINAEKTFLSELLYEILYHKSRTSDINQEGE